MKKLCSEDYCYKMVDVEDYVKMKDGTIHPMSLKCDECQGDAGRKNLKNYKKAMRYKANKKLKSTTP